MEIFLTQWVVCPVGGSGFRLVFHSAYLIKEILSG